jgi:hypothetical protein
MTPATSSIEGFGVALAIVACSISLCMTCQQFPSPFSVGCSCQMTAIGGRCVVDFEEAKMVSQSGQCRDWNDVFPVLHHIMFQANISGQLCSTT